MRPLVIPSWILLGVPLLAQACLPYDSTLCAACEVGGCEAGLECKQRVCVIPGEEERCLNYVPPPIPPSCGGAPPCEDGTECFEGRCVPPVDVSVGYGHICALWASGRVSCWGNNTFGEAGDPNAIFLTAPRLIEGLDEVVSISSGIDFNCALRKSGEGYCWGNNNDGQLGNITSDGSLRPFESDHEPQRVALDLPLRALRAKEHSVCAITETQELYCWGSGGSGCLLGDRRADNSQIPLRIASGVAYTQMDIGRDHFLGLQNGQIFGMGTNNSYQLGTRLPQGAGSCSPEPMDLGIQGVSQLAAGALLSCVVQGADQLSCFGAGYQESIAPRTVQLGAPVESIQAETDWGCAKLSEGPLACWGRDEEGQLGTWAHLDTPSGPELPVPIQGSERARAFDVGTFFGCFVGDDGVYCWGDNSTGILKNGGTSQSLAPEELILGSFVELSESCAIRADRAVVCWGDNRFGQLGRGFKSGFEDPGVVPGVTAIKLAGRAQHRCAITPQGELYCWGFAGPQQTSCAVSGLPSINSSSPIKIDGLPKLRDLAIFGPTTCVIAEDGEVYCFGCNQNRWASPETSAGWVTAPRRVPGQRGALKLALGNGLGCALFAGGEIRCWSTIPPTPEMASGLVLPGTLDFVVRSGFLLALQADGRVLGLGKNANGELGDGTLRYATSTTAVQGVTNAIALSSQADSSCVVQGDGSVVCWPLDLLVSDPAKRLKVRPFGVPDLPPVKKISGAGTSVCAIAQTGNIWCWGEKRVLNNEARPPYVLEPTRIERLLGPATTDGPP